MPRVGFLREHEENTNRGLWGVPKLFSLPKSSFFVKLNSVQNIQTIGQPPQGEEYVAHKRKKEQAGAELCQAQA